MADELLPSIDDEFAALEAEVQRLTKEPPKTSADRDQVLTALTALHSEWVKKLAAMPDRPSWRKRVDDTLQKAVARILRAGQTIDAAGNLGYQLDTAAANQALPEVLGAVKEGLTEAFVEKWTKPQPAGAAKPTVDAADVAAVVSMLFGNKPKKPAP